VNGGPVEYTEGGPPAGVTVATKRVNALTVDFTNTREGKVVGTNHVTISKDGKTMTLHVKGTDAKGSPVESTIVFDRQ
jgi:hypothetical protein